MSGTFGRIVTPAHVEKWIRDLADKWFTEYLADVEREMGKTPRFFPELNSIISANDFDSHWPEEALPSLMVTKVGLASNPRRNGDGSWDATWLFGCAIIASATTRQDTRDAVHAYTAALTTMMLQHRSLEQPNFVRNTDWLDGRPVPIRGDGERSLGAEQVIFAVEVKGVLTERGRPPAAEPRPDPYVGGGTVNIIDTTGNEININNSGANP